MCIGGKRVAGNVLIQGLFFVLLLGCMWEGTRGQDKVRPERISRAKLYTCVAFSPDSRWVAAAGAVEHSRAEMWEVWDTVTRKQVLSKSSSEEEPVICLAFSPDGRTLATGVSRGPITLWETITWRERTTLEWGNRTVTHLAFPKLDRLFAAGFRKGPAVSLWDVTSRKERYTLDPGEYANRFALSTDGKRFLMVVRGTAKVCDVETGKELCAFSEGHVEVAVFCPDGQTLATGGEDYKVRLWDIAAKKQKAVFVTQLRGMFSSLDVSADGKLLIVSGKDKDEDGLVEFWDVAAGKVLARSTIRQEAVMCAKLSPDGRWLVAGTRGWGDKGKTLPPGGLYLWDLRSLLGGR